MMFLYHFKVQHGDHDSIVEILLIITSVCTYSHGRFEVVFYV